MMHDTKKLWRSTVLPTSYTLSDIEQGAACCVPIPHIQIENISVSYYGKSMPEGVSLDINKGCITR